MAPERVPIILDPSGRDLQGETALCRTRGPVCPVLLPGDVLAWTVLGAAEARSILTDPRVSKDPEGHWPAWMDGRVPRDWPLALWVSVKSMFTADGAQHARLRKFVAGAFTLHRVKELRPAIEEMARELLDDIARLPSHQPFDLKSMYAAPLPARVTCSLFGVADHHRLALADGIAAVHDTSLSLDMVGAAVKDIYAILDEHNAEKRSTPGDDLTSALLAAQRNAVEEGDPAVVTDEELIDTQMHLLAAGYETTSSLIDQTVCALITHPDQLALIRSGRAGWMDAVEETLRWQPPAANYLLRFAIEDIELGGVLIARGDPIIVSGMGAGRDRDVHGDDADSFDITRETRRAHLSFGHGEHYCLGAPLGRLEASIAVSAIFARFPSLEFAVPADELEPVSSLVTNGHQTLPLLAGPVTPRKEGDEASSCRGEEGQGAEGRGRESGCPLSGAGDPDQTGEGLTAPSRHSRQATAP